jgi:hypothetical protein
MTGTRLPSPPFILRLGSLARSRLGAEGPLAR